MGQENPPKSSFWDYLRGNAEDNQKYGGFVRKYHPTQPTSVPASTQPGILQKLYSMFSGIDDKINDPALLAGLTGPHGNVQLKNQGIDPSLIADQFRNPIINAATDPKKLKLASK